MVKLLFILAFSISIHAVQFVGTGEGTNRLAYSNDGITWTGLGASIFSTSGYDAAYSFTQDRWVAVGSGSNTLAYSNDGISWTGLGTSIFSFKGNSLAYSDHQNKWVAVGTGTNTIAYSSDGITWNGLGLLHFSNDANGVAYSPNNDRWVAVGQSATGTSMAYSNDGITWISLGNSIFTTGFGVKFSPEQGLWVACGNNPNTFAHSNDGITWVPDGIQVFTSQVRSIAYGQGKWIATGADVSHSLGSSPDGITWSGQGKNDITSVGYKVNYHKNLNMWIAMGAGANKTIYSYDGLFWQPITTPVFMTVGYGVGVAYSIVTPLLTDVSNAVINGSTIIDANLTLTISGSLSVTRDMTVKGNWNLENQANVLVNGTINQIGNTTFSEGAKLKCTKFVLSSSSYTILYIVLSANLTANRKRETKIIEIVDYVELDGSYSEIHVSDPCAYATPSYGSSSLTVTLTPIPNCRSSIETNNPVINVTTFPVVLAQNQDFPTGAIVGISVGVAILGGGFILIMVLLFRRSSSKRDEMANEQLKNDHFDELSRSSGKPNPSFSTGSN